MAKFCPNCGTAIGEGTKFCPECGTLIQNEQSAVQTVTAEAEKEPPAETVKEEPIEKTIIAETAEKAETAKKTENSKEQAEPKPAKEKKISVGAACAAFLLGAKLVPYLIRSVWLMATLNALTTFQYALAEIAGMAVAFIALFGCAKKIAAGSRESKSAVFERSVLVTGLYFGIGQIGTFAMDKFAAGLSQQDLINTGIISFVIFILCIWAYSNVCAMVSAGEKRVSLGAKLFGGILFFLAYNMEPIVTLGLNLIPVIFKSSFLTYSGLILLNALIQGGLISCAVSAGLGKAKTREKVSSRVHLSRVIAGGALTFASAIVVLGTYSLPAVEEMCRDDLQLEAARGQVMLSAGDIPGALQAFDYVGAHAEAWRQIAADEGVGRSARDSGEDVLRALYLADHPGEVAKFAATGVIGVEDSIWYPFYLESFSGMEELSEEQKALQRDVANLCVANGSFVNVLPRKEEIQDASEAILKTCGEFGNVIEAAKIYRTARDASRGDFSQESAVYTMLDYADEYPENLLIQMAAVECGTGFLKDNAGHYEKVAEIIDRVNAVMEKSSLPKELLAKYQGVFGDKMSQIDYLERAEVYYEGAGNNGSDMQDIDLKMAVKAFMASDTERCIQYTAKLMERGEESPTLWHLHAVCSVKTGDYTAAVKSAGKLADYVKQGGSGDEYLLADLSLFNCVEYMAMRDDGYWTDFEYSFYSEEMDEELTVLFAANPFLDNYCKALYCNKMQENWEKAQACADSLVQECPDSAQVWYVRGLAYADGEKFEEAAKSFEKSLEIDGRQLNTMFALANTYDALGRYREAYNLTLQVEAEMGKGNEVNHSADVYGLGYHNPRLREALEYKLQEEVE